MRTRQAVLLLFLSFVLGTAAGELKAHDSIAIEQFMRSAMPLEAACSKGRVPLTCEFKTGDIDFDIEFSPVGGIFLAGGLRFIQLNEAAPYLASLVRLLARFEFSESVIRSCIAEAVEATSRHAFMGQAEISNDKFLLVCEFYRKGNASFADSAYRVALRSRRF